MTCAELDAAFDQVLDAPRAGWPPDAVSHVQSCPRCRALYGGLVAPSVDAPQVSPALCQRILATIQPELTPVRPLPPAGIFFAGFLILYGAVIAAGIFFFGYGAIARMTMAQLAGITLLTLAGALLTALSLTRQMTPGARQWFNSRQLVWAIPLAMLAVAALLFPWDRPWVGIAHGAMCTWSGLVISVPAALGAAWLLRRGYPLTPGVIGATAGLFAGLAGSLVLSYHCVMMEASHIMLWHIIGIPGTAAFLGWLFGRFLGAREGVAR